MKTRLYKPSDLETVIQLFYDVVHTVNAKDYTLEQQDAWAPKKPDVYRFEASLSRNHTLVVEENGKIIGFGDIGETGYLDRLFVSQDYLHQGVATMLCDQLEKYAKKKGTLYLNTASSITAKPFFEARGYTTLKEETIERRGVRMIRYLMEKKL